jgi:hypothetical protein
MTKTSDYSQQKKFFIAIIVTVVAIATLALIQNRTTTQLAIAPTGKQAVVFTNKSERKPLNSEATTTYSVQPGDTEVIVSSNDRYPWRETISTTASGTKLVRPFLVPEQPRILRDAPDTVKEQLARQQANPVTLATSSNQQVRVLAGNDGRLVAEWIGAKQNRPEYFRCDNESSRCNVKVYAQSDESIEQVDFYPGRSDVAVFATQGGVYAIEIDPTGNTQNFHPVNTTLTNPHFFVSEDSIFVGNKNRITVSRLQ